MPKIRRLLPALLMIGVVALSGCVYWRLLQFKRQFGDFSKHFEIRSGDHYALIIKEPLLSGEDVDFVMKAVPTRVDRRADEVVGRRYVFHLVGGSEDPRATLEYALRFEEDFFTEMHFPAEFCTLFPEDAMQSLLASLGSAETDRESESVRARIRKKRVRELMPDPARVQEALGPPSHRWKERDGLVRLLYDYKLETSTTGLKPHQTRAFGRFHYEGEVLRKVDASFAGRVFTFEIP